MNTFHPIPVVPGSLAGQTVQLVDARLLHQFLQSQQKFADWTKKRIRRYGFELEVDYLRHKTMTQVPHRGGLRRAHVDQYLLTLGMAKELAMVECTPLGRQARRYFIDCERQLRQMRERGIGAAPISQEANDPPPAIDLFSADIRAINRQAWADVAAETFARFHARREALLRQQQQMRQQAAQERAACADATGPQRSYVLLPAGFVPKWAQ